MRRVLLSCSFSLCLVATGWAQEASGSSKLAGLTPAEGDFTLHNFQFASGQSLPELRIHYYTFGKLQRDGGGRATNAVLILHGTSGSGRQFLM
jgi:homoserine O-acetyltransferase/O-succinyltransferase